MPDTMLRDDEPRLVDNPFRRESHKPWYARRGPRWVVGIAVVTLLGLNAFAFKKVSNRADPVSVDTAIARFRASTASSAGGAAPDASSVGPAAATATEVTTATAPTNTDTNTRTGTAAPIAGDAGEVGVERGPTPTPGVYVYDTSGFEHVSALGGATHNYPQQSTITITDNGCGIDMVWQPLEQRFDRWSTCVAGPLQVTLTSYTTHHEFFGQTEERKYPCQNVDIRPASDVPNTSTSGSCTRPPDTVNSTTTVVGPATVMVQGTPVAALQLHLAQVISGDSSGTQTIDIWLRTSDGLLLRYDNVVDGDSNTVIGPTHLHEEIHLDIADLTPHQ